MYITCDMHAGEGVWPPGLSLDAAEIDVILRRRPVAILDPDRRRVTGGEEVGDAITDRGYQAFPVGCELDPAVVTGRFCYESAPTLE